MKLFQLFLMVSCLNLTAAYAAKSSVHRRDFSAHGQDQLFFEIEGTRCGLSTERPKLQNDITFFLAQQARATCRLNGFTGAPAIEILDNKCDQALASVGHCTSGPLGGPHFGYLRFKGLEQTCVSYASVKCQ